MKLVLLALMLTAIAATASERAIHKEVVVAASVREVYAAWTTEAGLKTFFAPGAHVELRPGGPFEILFDEGAPPGQRGSEGCIVLAFQEDKMLSFTWNAPPKFPEIRKQRTHVLLTFEPKDGGHTLVRFNQDGWGTGGEWDQVYDYFDKAWAWVLGSLQDRFAKGPVDWKAQEEGRQKK